MRTDEGRRRFAFGKAGVPQTRHQEGLVGGYPQCGELLQADDQRPLASSRVAPWLITLAIMEL